MTEKNKERIAYLDKLLQTYNKLNFDEFLKKSNEVKNCYLELSELLIDSTKDQNVQQTAFQFAVFAYFLNPSKYIEDKIIKLSELLAKNGVETIHQLVNIFPDNLNIQINGAMYYLKHNKFFESASLYLSAFRNCKDKNLKGFIAFQISSILRNMNLRFISYNYLDIANNLRPNEGDILNTLGVMNVEARNIKKASKFFDKAINAVKEDSKKSTFMMNKALGISYLRDFKFSQDLYLQSLGLDPTNHYALQNKLLDLTYIPELSMEEIYNEHKKINKMFNIFNKSIDLEQVEKIGVVAGDLNKMNHPVSFFSEVFNHQKFVIYHNDYIDENDYPNANVKIVKDYDDDTLRKLIKADNIDILIDLSTHTNKNRLSLFAEKCAPVQIQYLAYPVFSGLETIDYYITDKEVETEITKELYGDKILNTKNCFICYSDINKDLNIDYKPSNDKVRIGVFNRITKLSEPFMNTLKKIADKYEDIEFVFKNSELKNKENIDYLKKFIPEEKLKFLDWYSNPQDALKVFDEVEVCVDSNPYSGTTTSCDTLSRGTPVITLSSKSKNFQNVTKSILVHSDLSEFVCESEEELIEKVYNIGKKVLNGEIKKEDIKSKFYENICNVENFRNDFLEMLNNLKK